MGRRSTRIAVTLAGMLMLSGCSSASAIPTCEEIDCTGVIDGAAYEVLLPQQWNGTLIVYSHGYRNTQPIPPGFEPVNTAPEPAPGWASRDRGVGQALLDQGYALAGSAFSANGWAVVEGVEANAALVEWFTQNVAEPQRVLAWGDSLGGLISVVWGQEQERVDGVLAMCAPLAGVVPNVDLAYQAAQRLQSDIWPELPITGFTSYEEALAAGVAAAQVITQLADIPIDPRLTDLDLDERASELDLPLLEVPTLAPDPQYVRRLAEELGAPQATRQFDGATEQSQVAVAAESLVTAVTFGTLIRYELAERLGGEVGDPAATATRAAAAPLGSPTGALIQPTFALHTIDDPVTIAQNVTVFADRVRAAGASDRLTTWFTVPPDVFPVDPGAPYGAGHCNFTEASRLGALGALADWVESGEPPVATDQSLGAQSGFVPGQMATPWPIPLEEAPILG